jgi:hypothetical protein
MVGPTRESTEYEQGTESFITLNFKFRPMEKKSEKNELKQEKDRDTVARAVTGAALIGTGYLLHELLDEMDTRYCPTCGEEADYFVKKKRHYCWSCEQYLDKIEK